MIKTPPVPWHTEEQVDQGAAGQQKIADKEILWSQDIHPFD